MAIAENGIARIDALLSALGSDAAPETLAEALPQLLPGVECRRCDARDVLEEPFREAGRVDIHLLDTSNHCIKVTDQPAEATALLIAEKESA